MAVVGAVASAVAVAVTATTAFVQQHATALLTLAAVAVVAVVSGTGWTASATSRRRRRLRRLAELASVLAENPSSTPGAAQELLELRAQLGALPLELSEHLESLYRWAVAEAVSDQHVTQTERLHLESLAEGLGLSQDVVKRANVEGFLQGFSVLVADERLTSEEEALLTDLQEALGVSADAVQAQMNRAAELRTAREVAAADLPAVDVPIKLRPGEMCYHTVPFTEQRRKVIRSYIEEGVRHTERDLVPARQGRLYVTNQRLLLVAEGTTNIKLDKVLDSAVDAEANVLAVTVDGRIAPFYFEVPEPYVTQAVVDRARA